MTFSKSDNSRLNHQQNVYAP